MASVEDLTRDTPLPEDSVSQGYAEIEQHRNILVDQFGALGAAALAVTADDINNVVGNANTEGAPLISSEDTLTGRMKLAVVASMPVTPDDDTIYFVTG